MILAETERIIIPIIYDIMIFYTLYHAIILKSRKNIKNPDEHYEEVLANSLMFQSCGGMCEIDYAAICKTRRFPF